MTEKFNYSANGENVEFLTKKVFELFKIIEKDFDVDIKVTEVLCAIIYVLIRIYKTENIATEDVLRNMLITSYQYDIFENSEKKKQQHWDDFNGKIHDLPEDSA